MPVGTDGDDVLVGGAGGETLDGGAGTDTASYASAATGVIANLAAGTVGYELRVMPLGDSITYGVASETAGGYRGPLWDKLTADGVTLNFVGSGVGGTLDDPDNEGHPGWTIGQIEAQVNGWINAADPDVVLLMIGTNDTKGNPLPTATDLIARLSHLIDSIAAGTDPPKLFIGPIPPMTADQPADRIALAQAYNALIPDLVAQKHAAGVDVTFVDMSDLTPADITAPPQDPGLHPNANGYEKIAEHWHDALMTLGVDGGTLAGAPNDALVSIENLEGSAYQDVLTGDGGANRLVGLGGKDVLDGGAGADTMVGGTGNDTYVVDDVGDQITELAGEGVDTVRTSLASFTLSANFEYLTHTGDTPFAGTGNVSVNIIWGGDGADTLDGQAGKDTIFGGAGDDRIVGGLDVDRMEGGAGNDTYVVDTSGDVVVEAAGAGVDTVEAGRNWVLGANIENLVLTGTSSLTGTGNGEANLLTGNAGNNILDGAGGADTMVGMAGNDTYFVDNAGDLVSEVDPGSGANAGGNDIVNTTLASFTLGSFVEKLTFVGVDPGVGFQGVGNDLANTITGAAGDDTLSGGGDVAKDMLVGGAGNDTYVVYGGDSITEAASGGQDRVRTDLAAFTLGANIEELVYTGSAGFRGIGNDLANAISGGAGADTLDGGAGDDTLVGGADTAADSLTGGAGNDVYTVYAGDVVTEAAGGGEDRIQTDLAVYSLAANFEHLLYTGTATFRGTGNDLANQISGGVGGDTLDGGAGDDTLNGGADSVKDTLIGGAGNDVYIVSTADVVTENAAAGQDRIQTDLVSFTLTANIEELAYIGSAAFRGTGNDLANIIIGGVGNDILDGGKGADDLRGGGGNDTYLVDDAADTVTETDGSEAGGSDTVNSKVGTYTLSANVEKLLFSGTGGFAGTGNDLANSVTGGLGADTLRGADNNDTLKGGGDGDGLWGDAGNDKLFGEGGADTLSGGLGVDALTGGEGADRFLFSEAVANSKDTIADFALGEDKFAIVASGFSASLTPGALDPEWLVVGSSATFVGHGQFVFNPTNSTLFWDPDGKGGASAIALTVVTGVSSVSSADFILI